MRPLLLALIGAASLCAEPEPLPPPECPAGYVLEMIGGSPTCATTWSTEGLPAPQELP